MQNIDDMGFALGICKKKLLQLSETNNPIKIEKNSNKCFNK
jgi:hypothetical protein